MPSAAVAQLIDYCRNADSATQGETRSAVGKALLDEAKQDPRVLAEACASIAELPRAGAAWIALCAGTAVENGIDAAHSFPGLWTLSWINVPPHADLDAASDVEGEQHSSPSDAETLQYVGQSIVSHLARLPGERARLRAEPGVLAKLDASEHRSYGITWVLEALRRRNGSVLLLHATERIGFRVRFENVNNCFHLFSLLQAALGDSMPGGKPPARSLIDVLEGRSQAKVSDSAHWHYGDARSNTSSIMASIWGEGGVDDIPDIQRPASDPVVAADPR